MSVILFTDSIGPAKLHNEKPFPASKVAGWTPDSTPFGDSAARLSDGAITQLRLRDDHVVAFELAGIPSRRGQNLVIQAENFGLTWSVNGTPTRVAAAHVASGVTLDLIGDDSAAVAEYYFQAITLSSDSGPKGVSIHAKAGTIQAGNGWDILLQDTTAGVNRLQAQVRWNADGSPNVYSVPAGIYVGPIYKGFGVYRLLFISASTIAVNNHTIFVRPALTTTEMGNVYAGGIQVEYGSPPQPYLYTTTATVGSTSLNGTSLLDIAVRLRRHLINGGQCALSTADALGTAYPTLGLKHGTVPQIALTDRRTMEYTFSAQLVNLAASPVAMSAYFADQ